MKAERIYKHWRKHLKSWCDELEKEWHECRRTGDVESIHRLRVVLRRLRVGLRLGNRWLGRDKVAAFRKWSQRVTNALGPVRDVDVTLEWLAAHSPPAALTQLLQQRRARLWRQARRKLTRLAQVPTRLTDDKPGRVAKKLARRFHRTVAEDRQEVLAFNTPLDTRDTEHWHELRRDLRRIRYLWEMVLTPRERKKDALLKKLLALQELLGNAQNCVAAMQALRPLAQKPEVAAALRQLEQDRRQWLAQAQKALRAFQKSRALRTLDAEH
ncbi:MAG: CHAD domain-containing protein [Verrucomicrobiae bacterium]|nr:CHAD domain-containing protein [Verrucomicrobiae bacterium]